MAVSAELINFDTSTFKVLYTCFGLLIVKMLLMVPLTGFYRFTKKVFASPEDRAILGHKNVKVAYDDPDVERVRRAHLNDLENILIFFTTGFLYVSLNPSPFLAIPLLIAYTIARYAHTFVYAVKVIDQPARFICYAIGFGITAFMALTVVLSMKDAM